jgi:hypothetical protein
VDRQSRREMLAGLYARHHPELVRVAFALLHLPNCNDAGECSMGRVGFQGDNPANVALDLAVARHLVWVAPSPSS